MVKERFISFDLLVGRLLMFWTLFQLYRTKDIEPLPSWRELFGPLWDQEAKPTAGVSGILRKFSGLLRACSKKNKK